MGIQGKEEDNREKYVGKLIKKSPKIKGDLFSQDLKLLRENTPTTKYFVAVGGKETVDIDILIKSTNGDRNCIAYPNSK